MTGFAIPFVRELDSGFRRYDGSWLIRALRELIILELSGFRGAWMEGSRELLSEAR